MSTQVCLGKNVSVMALDTSIWLNNTTHDTENHECASTTVHFASPEQAREVALKLIAVTDAIDEARSNPVITDADPGDESDRVRTRQKTRSKGFPY